MSPVVRDQASLSRRNGFLPKVRNLSYNLDKAQTYNQMRVGRFVDKFIRNNPMEEANE